jgi:hypothetical protein
MFFKHFVKFLCLDQHKAKQHALTSLFQLQKPALLDLLACIPVRVEVGTLDEEEQLGVRVFGQVDRQGQGQIVVHLLEDGLLIVIYLLLEEVAPGPVDQRGQGRRVYLLELAGDVQGRDCHVGQAERGHHQHAVAVQQVHRQRQSPWLQLEPV